MALAVRNIVLRIHIQNGTTNAARKIVCASQSRNYCCQPGDHKHVGFIGLGNMGAYMATNLIQKGGFKVVAYDIASEAVQSVVKNGATKANSIADVAKSTENIVTMLPSNQTVLDVYCGENGLLNNVKPGSLLLDSSTCEPDIMKQISAQAIKKGINFIDAPVSGGVNAARLAKLTFMIGGDQKNYERALPIVGAMGAKAVHCGGIGAGQIAKICNNMLLGIHMIGTAECMNLGIKMGLDPKTLLSIVNSSSGRNWSSEVYSPVPDLMESVPSNSNYDGGFMAKLIAKDLGFASNLATQNNCPIPLGSSALQMYQTLKVKGLGDKDFSIVYEYLKGASK